MVIELTDKNYVDTVESTDKPMFIDFYSPSCGPCQELIPLLPVLDEHAKGDVLICAVNVAKNPKLAKKYEIQSVPFCVTVDKNKMVKDVQLGLGAADMYYKMLDKVLEKPGFFKRLFG